MTAPGLPDLPHPLFGVLGRRELEASARWQREIGRILAAQARRRAADLEDATSHLALALEAAGLCPELQVSRGVDAHPWDTSVVEQWARIHVCRLAPEDHQVGLARPHQFTGQPARTIRWRTRYTEDTKSTERVREETEVTSSSRAAFLRRQAEDLLRRAEAAEQLAKLEQLEPGAVIVFTRDYQRSSLAYAAILVRQDGDRGPLRDQGVYWYLTQGGRGQDPLSPSGLLDQLAEWKVTEVAIVTEVTDLATWGNPPATDGTSAAQRQALDRDPR